MTIVCVNKAYYSLDYTSLLLLLLTVLYYIDTTPTRALVS